MMNKNLGSESAVYLGTRARALACAGAMAPQLSWAGVPGGASLPPGVATGHPGFRKGVALVRTGRVVLLASAPLRDWLLVWRGVAAFGPDSYAAPSRW